MNPRIHRLGAVALTVLALACVASGALAWRVYAALHPPRTVEGMGRLQDDVLRIEDVTFPSGDGTELSGWVLEGETGRPWVILAHDLGSNKGELLHVGLAIQNAGFHVLLFDFRGHGESGDRPSGLGVTEKADVLAALDLVRSRDDGPVALVGVGMGAHACTLAAADRPEVRVLVLDGLHPDGAEPLLERTFAGWEFGARRFGFLARWIYAGVTRDNVLRERAEDSLARLSGRHVLMLADATEPARAEAMKRMVAEIPESRDGEGNLVTLPGTASGRLYGENSDRYRARVVAFLHEHLHRS